MSERLIYSTNLSEIKDAWLSPGGAFVISAAGFDHYSFHVGLAYYIIADKHQLKSWHDTTDYLQDNKLHYDPVIYLENKKWVRLHSFQGRRNAYFIVPDDARIPKRQESAIVDWATAHNKTFQEALDYTI